LIYTVVGGDERQIRLTRLLLQDGHKVYTWGIGQDSVKSIEEAVAKAECVIWPLPLLTKAGMLNIAGGSYPPTVVMDAMRGDQVGIGGRIPLWLLEQARDNGLTLVDYVKREDFAIANAVPTAFGKQEYNAENTENYKGYRTLHELENRHLLRGLVREMINIFYYISSHPCIHSTKG